MAEPATAPAPVQAPLQTEPLSYWSLVGKQFRRNSMAVVSAWMILVLFLLSTWAPLLCEGRPLVWCKDGQTTYPLLRWFCAPTSSIFTVDYLFNYFASLSLTLPLSWLFVRWRMRGRHAPRAVRNRRLLQASLVACLVALLPFIGPGSYERQATEAELKANPAQKILTEYHVFRRWKLDAPEYLKNRERLDAAMGDYAIFPLAAQDPLATSSQILNPPGVYVQFENKCYYQTGPGYLAAPNANIPLISMEAVLEETKEKGAYRIAGQPEGVRVLFSPSKDDPAPGQKVWLYGEVLRTGAGTFDFLVAGARPLPTPPLRVRHLLGTDEQGRDVLARLLHGGRISLSVGLVAVALSALLGVIIGGLAGYYRGWVDIAISRLIEIVICFPTFFLILTIIAVMEERNIILVMVVIGATSWTGMARLVRGEFLKLVDQDFVHAARALGCSGRRVMFRHILPNAMGPLLVTLAFAVAGAVFIESSLSYLGFGAPPPTPSWGEMVRQGMSHVMEGAWWLMFFPGFMIFLTLCVYNLAGEGLRDAMDPRLRK
ncbi:MAG: ABC transporter permease [Planctomycetes bacterium]|nr:ABC transporter permease [Planctomycetota bacterium]